MVANLRPEANDAIGTYNHVGVPVFPPDIYRAYGIAKALMGSALEGNYPSTSGQPETVETAAALVVAELAGNRTVPEEGRRDLRPEEALAVALAAIDTLRTQLQQGDSV